MVRPCVRPREPDSDLPGSLRRGVERFKHATFFHEPRVKVARVSACHKRVIGRVDKVRPNLEWLDSVSFFAQSMHDCDCDSCLADAAGDACHDYPWYALHGDSLTWYFY